MAVDNLVFWVSVLFGPSLWWLWESVIVFCYFTFRFFRSWGKDFHILLRWSEGGWHQVGRYMVSQTVQWFRSRSGRSFTAEPNMGSFDITDLSGNHVVVLHNYDYARPPQTKNTDARGNEIKQLENQAPNGKDVIKIDITKSKEPKAGNPSSTDFDTFAAGEAWKQGLQANAKKKTDYAPLIMAIVIGALGGFMIAYIGFPQHIPVPVPLPTTVTVTT